MPADLGYMGSKPKAKISGGMPCWTKAVLKGGKSVVYHVTAKALRGASGRLRKVATTKADGGKALHSPAVVAVQARQPKPTPVTG